MKFVKILFASLLLILIAICGISYWVYNAVSTPHDHAKGSEYIKIEKGSTPREIIAKLTTEGVISSEMATLVYLRTIGDGTKLQAGEYQFPSPISPLQVLKVLEKGEDRTIKLTIPEGFTRFDIAKRIAEKFGRTPPATAGGTDSLPMDDKAVLALMNDTTLIRDISPTAKDLEGYMYPTTYSFARDAKSQEIIKRMVDEFKKFWKPEWSDAAKAMGRTPQEIVTIASLIQTEAGVETDRPLVSSVIYNRLKRGTPLGIDQTNIYIAKMQGRWDGTINKSDLDVDSPYNTRKFPGIPPGPISSVTESSIKAALNPAQTDYLFYVRNVDANDGTHWFYSSAAEFEKGKAKYQAWLERERQEKRAEATGNNN